MFRIRQILAIQYAGRIHTGTFRPDEKALGYGVVQFINIVFTVLG